MNKIKINVKSIRENIKRIPGKIQFVIKSNTCGCWAHLRRYMFEAIPKKKGNETQSSPAKVGLAYCDQLF